MTHKHELTGSVQSGRGRGNRRGETLPTRRTNWRGFVAAALGALVALAILAGLVGFAGTAAAADVDSCTVIDEAGTYELTGDVTNNTATTCFEITASDVVFDGNAHTIHGQDGTGTGIATPEFSGLSNVTVRDVNVTNMASVGIWIRWTDGIVLEDVAVHGAGSSGISVDADSHDFEGTNIVVSHNEFGGIFLEGDRPTLQNVVANDSETGSGVSIESSVSGPTSLSNVSANRNGGFGVSIGASDVAVTDVTGADNNNGEFGLNDVDNVSVDNADLGSAVVSFEGSGVEVEGPGVEQSAPGDSVNVGGNFSTQLNSGWGPASLNVTVHYDESDIGVADESTLSLWRYDDPDWVEAGTSSVDTDANTVSANFTGFVTSPPTTIGAFGDEDPSLIDSCSVIDQPGTYELTKNLTVSDHIDWGMNKLCINIKSNDVVFDGNGHTITGPGTGIPSYGVSDRNSTMAFSNVTVTNVILTDWRHNVVFEDLTNSSINNVTVDTGYEGILLEPSGQSSNNTVTDNVVTVSTSRPGIELHTSNTTVSRNNVTGGQHGIQADGNDNEVTDNTAANGGSGAGIHVAGERALVEHNDLSSYNHGVRLASGLTHVVRSNDVDDNENTGISVQSSDSIVSNNVVSNNGDPDGPDFYDNAGIFLDGSVNTSVTDNTLTNNVNGIRSDAASDQTLANNTIQGSDEIGILLSSTSVDTFTNNTVTGSGSSALNTTDGPAIAVTDLHLDTSTISFTARDTALGLDSTFSDAPSGYERTGDPLSADSTGANTFLNVSLPYSGPSGDFETSLRLWNHDGSTWTEVPDSTVDAGTQTVTGNATGFGSGHTLAIVGGPTTIAVDPLSPTFGTVEVGTGSASENVTIENDGTVDLEISGTSVTGENASDYTIAGGGGAPTLQPDDTHNVTVEFAPGSIGSKSANLTIESNDPDQPTFNVSLSGTGEDNTDPVADAGGDRTVDEDDLQSFNGSASTDNGQLVSYEWEFGDGGAATGENVSYTYSEPDTYTLNLTVTDAAGNSDTDEVEVTVTDTTPPTADAGPDLTGMLNDEVQFNGSNSTDNVGVDSWEWDFGDGSSNATVEAPTHSYDTGGTYTVTLTVADAAGNEDVDTLDVTVAIDECTVISESGDYRLAANLSSGDDCIVIESSNVTFDGMGHTIEYDGDFFASGVLVGDTTSPNNVTVTNVTVADWSAAGVTYENVDDGEISNVTATVGEDAIGIEVSDQSTGNLLKDNEVTGSGEEGIIISDSADDNILRDNEVNGPNYGISVLDSTGVNITNGNVVTATTTYGVRIWQGSDNARISDAKLTGVDGSGVFIWDSNGVTVENSNISANTLGIELEIADGSTLSNNTVSDNADSTDGHGIYLWDSGSSLMANNTVGNNTGDGIRLESSSTGATIQDNKVKNNDLGISIDTSATNPTLTNNTVVDSAGRGIESQADNTALTNNVIQDGEDHGIWLSGSSNVLTNNTASDNAGDGIAIQTFASSYTLSNNSANDNDGTGIHFSGDGGHDVDGLTANGNTVGVGVGVASDANTVENVTANDNAEYGVQIDDATDNTLTNVTAQSNGLWDFYAEDGSRTDVTDFDVGSTVASFEAVDVSISGVDSTPAAPTGFERTGGSLNASTTTVDGWLDITLPYTGATGDFEASLGLWHHDGNDWSEVAGSTVDTGADTVSANVTSFSTFAIVGGPADVEVDTSSLDFGDVEVDTDTNQDTLTIENNGSVDLNVTATVISGANESEFTITVGDIPSTVTLQPGDTHMVTVEFEPNEHIGTKTARLTVQSDDPDEPTVNVTLTGDGVDTTDPTADAGDDVTVDEDTVVTLDGSGSTDNGQIASYVWAIDGETIGTGETADQTPDQPGTYMVNLTVTDAAGNNDTDSLVVTVEDVTPPTVDAGPDQTVDEDDEVSFNGSNSTDNVGIDTYEWEFGDGNTSDGVTANHTYPSPGTYTVNLSANDSAGNVDTDSLVVTVEDVTPPVVDAGENQTIDEDTVVNFDGSNSTDNVGIDSFEWEFGDGNTSTGEMPDHTYVDPGSYMVNLTAADAGGNAETDSIVVTVNDTTAPAADAGANQTVTEGQSVSFDASDSTDNGQIVAYAWDFDDGANATGATTTHTYAQPGTYTANLTVTDAAGHNDTDSVAITVEAEPSGGGGGGGDSTSTTGTAASSTGSASASASSVGRQLTVTVEGADMGDTVTVQRDDEEISEELQRHGVALEAIETTFTGQANFEMTLTTSNAKPDPSIPDPPSDPSAVGYVNVEHSTSDDAVGEVRFGFRVTPERLEEAGVGTDEVVLYRYSDDGEWTALEAELVGTAEDGSLRFRAVSPGLSVFAIGGQQAQQTTPDGGTTTPEPGTSTPDVTTAGPSDTGESPTSSSPGQPGFGVIVALLAILAVALAIRRHA